MKGRQRWVLPAAKAGWEVGPSSKDTGLSALCGKGPQSALSVFCPLWDMGTGEKAVGIGRVTEMSSFII